MAASPLVAAGIDRARHLGHPHGGFEMRVRYRVRSLSFVLITLSAVGTLQGAATVVGAEDPAEESTAKPPEWGSPAMIDAELHLRRALHFAADRTTVEQRYAKTSPSAARPAGALFTAEEEREFQFRQDDLQEDARRIAEYAKAFPDEYGGAYLDHSLGGKIVAGFTSQVQAHELAISALVPHRERVVVRLTRHTEADLNTAAGALEFHALAEKYGTKVTWIGTDIALNGLRVGILPPSAGPTSETSDIPSRIEAEASIASEVEFDGFAVSSNEDSDDVPPILAGHALNVGCTAGLPAFNNQGHYGFLIAGHCVDFPGQTVTHNGAGSNGGIVNGFGNGGNYDWAFIDGFYVSGSYSQARTFGTWPNSISFEGTDAGYDIQGNIRCKSGKTTNLTCGPIISMNYNWTDSDSGVSYTNQRRVDATAGLGDSGAAVWHSIGNSAYGAGVQSGKSLDGTKFQYMHRSYLPASIALRVQGDTNPPPVGGPSWYQADRNAGLSHPTVAAFQYAFAGAQPMLCDWNGDGRDTPGVFYNGVWYARNSNTAGAAHSTWAFGAAGDQAFCGDWDNDGIDTVGIRRGITNMYRNSNSNGPVDLACNWGNPGDVTFAGNWDGSSWDSIALKRSAQYFMSNFHCGESSWSFSYSTASYKVVAGDWDNNGTDTIGTFGGGFFYLRNSNSCCTANYTYPFGVSSDRPAAGNWFNNGPSSVAVIRGM
jgi:hypothetical protein